MESGGLRIVGCGRRIGPSRMIGRGADSSPGGGPGGPAAGDGGTGRGRRHQAPTASRSAPGLGVVPGRDRPARASRSSGAWARSRRVEVLGRPAPRRGEAGQRGPRAGRRRRGRASQRVFQPASKRIAASSTTPGHRRSARRGRWRARRSCASRGWRIASRSRRAAGSAKTIRPRACRSTVGLSLRRPSATASSMPAAEPLDDPVAGRPLGQQGVADRVGVEHPEPRARRRPTRPGSCPRRCRRRGRSRGSARWPRGPRGGRAVCVAVASGLVSRGVGHDGRREGDCAASCAGVGRATGCAADGAVDATGEAGGGPRASSRIGRGLIPRAACGSGRRGIEGILDGRAAGDDPRGGLGPDGV